MTEAEMKGIEKFYGQDTGLSEDQKCAADDILPLIAEVRRLRDRENALLKWAHKSHHMPMCSETSRVDCDCGRNAAIGGATKPNPG